MFDSSQTLQINRFRNQRDSPVHDDYQDQSYFPNYPENDDQYLPEDEQIACDYCGETSENTLFRCAEAECGRWFCNNSFIKETKASHLIFHLNTFNHKKVEVHEFSQLGPIVFECISCKTSNIFSLGYIPAFDAIYCRVPCLNDFEIEISAWMPLVVDKALALDDFYLNAGIRKNKRNKPISIKIANEIESAYLPSGYEEEDLELLESKPILQRYPNLKVYLKRFISLLIHNEAEDRKAMQGIINEIVFHFNSQRTGGFIYGFEAGCKFSFTDTIFISDITGAWDSHATLIEIREAKFFFELSVKAPLFVTKVSMRVEEKKVKKNRTRKELERFMSENVDIDEDIVKILLGQKKESFIPHSYNTSDFSIPGMKILNSTQNIAVRNALKYKFSIIEGPPGTGKTETIVTIVYNILNLRRKSYEELLQKKKMNRTMIDIFTEARGEADLSCNVVDYTNTICKKVDKLILPQKNKVNEGFNRKLQKEIKELNAQIKAQEDEISNLRFKLKMMNHVLDPQYSDYENNLLMMITQKTMEVAKLQSKAKQIELINKQFLNSVQKKEALFLETEANRPVKTSSLQPIDDFDTMLSNDPSGVSVLNYSYMPDSKILVCASSNTAVTHLAQKLSKIDPNLLHIYARSKEEEFKFDETSLRYKIHNILRDNKKYNFYKHLLDVVKKRKKIQNDKPNVKKRSHSVDSASNSSDSQESFDDIFDYSIDHQLAQEIKSIQNKDLNRNERENYLTRILEKMREVKAQVEKSIIKDAEIVCCTCASSSIYILNEYKFQHVLIDEATQNLEPETVQCFLKGASHVVLIGDTMQLGAVVKSNYAGDLGLSVSLMQRLLDNDVPRQQLKVQYRMHPDIAEFSNIMFYQGSIQNGVSYIDRHYHGFQFPEPVGDRPSFFYNIESSEEIDGSGCSFVNRSEAVAIKKILNYMYDCGIPPEHIGIITFYEGQRGYLRFYLENGENSLYMSKIEIWSVDASQGREKEFIILSCVRANQNSGVGFLKAYQRLNVAMTRAKYGLIICGDFQTLSSDELWEQLINFYAKKRLIFQGDFENMDELEIDFGDLEPYTVSRRLFYGDEMGEYLQNNNSGDDDDYYY
ncbi:hypothetical protein SteCoe_12777 [Stentor coeruleus]|uniref:Upf1 domain-containing protein n=1 Tax=Stentor coeruleus TaxID=5963 RepID=A0A1R2C9U6_9CILI|nr:hypothetical protein SteCoe_12777 [Stentor coeruleus]